MQLSRITKSVVIGAAFFACLPLLFTRTFSASSAPVEDSAALYGQKCAICHGKGGQGTPAWKAKGQPDFTDSKYQASVTDQQISHSIRDGKGKYMPAFKGKLTDQQVSAMVAQVRAFGKGK